MTAACSQGRGPAEIVSQRIANQAKDPNAHGPLRTERARGGLGRAVSSHGGELSCVKFPAAGMRCSGFETRTRADEMRIFSKFPPVADIQSDPSIAAKSIVSPPIAHSQLCSQLQASLFSLRRRHQDRSIASTAVRIISYSSLQSQHVARWSSTSFRAWSNFKF